MLKIDRGVLRMHYKSTYVWHGSDIYTVLAIRENEYANQPQGTINEETDQGSHSRSLALAFGCGYGN